jgi:hypothetical protein
MGDLTGEAIAAYFSSSWFILMAEICDLTSEAAFDLLAEAAYDFTAEGAYDLLAEAYYTSTWDT